MNRLTLLIEVQFDSNDKVSNSLGLIKDQKFDQNGDFKLLAVKSD